MYNCTILIYLFFSHKNKIYYFNAKFVGIKKAIKKKKLKLWIFINFFFCFLIGFFVFFVFMISTSSAQTLSTFCLQQASSSSEPPLLCNPAQSPKTHPPQPLQTSQASMSCRHHLARSALPWISPLTKGNMKARRYFSF